MLAAVLLPLTFTSCGDNKQDESFVIPDDVEVIDVTPYLFDYWGDFHENGGYDYVTSFITSDLYFDSESEQGGFKGTGYVVYSEFVTKNTDGLFPLPGVYEILDGVDSGTARAGFVDKSGGFNLNTGCYVVAYNGNVRGETKFVKSGKIVIEGIGDNAHIIFYYEYEDGTKQCFEYSGPVEIFDITEVEEL